MPSKSLGSMDDRGGKAPQSGGAEDDDPAPGVPAQVGAAAGARPGDASVTTPSPQGNSGTSHVRTSHPPATRRCASEAALASAIETNATRRFRSGSARLRTRPAAAARRAYPSRAGDSMSRAARFADHALHQRQAQPRPRAAGLRREERVKGPAARPLVIPGPSSLTPSRTKDRVGRRLAQRRIRPRRQSAPRPRWRQD